MRRATQTIRLVNQQVNPLTPLQNLLNVLAHNIPHIVNFGLNILEGVILASLCGAVLDHQALEVGIETRSAVSRQRSKVGIGVGGEEALLDFDEVAKGDAAAEVLLGDDEVGEARCRGGGCRGGVGDVVDVVCAVGVGEFLGRRVVNLWQNERGERRGCRGGRGRVFGKDCVFVGDARVEQGRCRAA